jgi:hypothetical protein
MAEPAAQQTIVCMKWGTRYGPDYVNRLASMVRRHTRRTTRFLCFTDDPTGILSDIATAPLPPIALPAAMTWSTWRKLSVWQYPLVDVSGDVLFLDLDLVVSGPLDDFFDFEAGRYAAIRNWTQPGERIGNTSVFRFRAGRDTHIFDGFVRDPAAVMRRWRTEQHYISDSIGDMAFWPESWCVSFKHTLLPPWPLNFVLPPKLPRAARIVAFTGKPKPDEALAGRWPVRSRRERLYKHTRPAAWIAEHWR